MLVNQEWNKEPKEKQREAKTKTEEETKEGVRFITRDIGYMHRVTRLWDHNLKENALLFLMQKTCDDSEPKDTKKTVKRSAKKKRKSDAWRVGWVYDTLQICYRRGFIRICQAQTLHGKIFVVCAELLVQSLQFWLMNFLFCCDWNVDFLFSFDEFPCSITLVFSRKAEMIILHEMKYNTIRANFMPPWL